MLTTPLRRHSVADAYSGTWADSYLGFSPGGPINSDRSGATRPVSIGLLNENPAHHIADLLGILISDALVILGVPV